MVALLNFICSCMIDFQCHRRKRAAFCDGDSACSSADVWCPESSGLHCYVECLADLSCYFMDLYVVEGLVTGATVDCARESYCSHFDVTWQCLKIMLA